jgi:hypothetical protein
MFIIPRIMLYALCAARCSSSGWMVDKMSCRTIAAKTGEAGQPCEKPSFTSMITHDPSSLRTTRLQIPVAVPVAYESEPGMRPTVSTELLQLEGNSTETFLISASL